MQDEREKLRRDIALFRYGLISDLIHVEGGRGSGLYRRLREKAERDYRIPGSERTRVALEMLRDWLKLYRKGGFDALVPSVRRDLGRVRAVPQQVCDLLVALKEEHPALSVQMVIERARASGNVPPDTVLAPSTVHRLLAHAGLMEPGEAASSGDRRRFAFERAGELWMSDVMHGPAVLTASRQKRRAYLIALLDDATRVIPFAAFALAENTQAYLPVLKGALVRRGIPQRLYVDNGAAYRSHQLALVCAKLGITLIHTRPYDAAAKGKQERWFRTVRMRFLPLVTAEDTQSLEALNRKLWAWVEGEYHHAPHRGLGGDTPLDRWATSAAEVRHVTPEIDLDDLMLWEEKRRVQKDRTVSLHGVVYEVDAALVGATVTLRFDPSGPRRSVQVWKDGRRLADAKPVDLYANCFVRRDRPSSTLATSQAPSPPPAGLRLAELRARREDDGGGRRNR
jgi:putative transposase